MLGNTNKQTNIFKKELFKPIEIGGSADLTSDKSFKLRDS